jgi:hypothetical protein
LETAFTFGPGLHRGSNERGHVRLGRGAGVVWLVGVLAVEVLLEHQSAMSRDEQRVGLRRGRESIGRSMSSCTSFAI